MNNGFPKYNEQYKTLINSILAFSSSGIAVLIVFIKSGNICISASNYIKVFIAVSLIGFCLSILLTLLSAYITLVHYSKEGEDSNQKTGREIIKESLCVIRIASMPFVISFITLIYILIVSLYPN